MWKGRVESNVDGKSQVYFLQESCRCFYRHQPKLLHTYTPAKPEVILKQLVDYELNRWVSD